MKLFRNEKLSYLWLVLRVWLGWQWLEAGLDKIGSPAWTGENAGAAVSGFFQGAIAKASGEHPTVQGWYASFLQNVALPNAQVFAYLVSFGEVIVGISLIAGFLTTFAALVGAFMNLNFMLAGSSSTNPLMYTVAILVAIAGYNAGRIGLDRYVMPYIRQLRGADTSETATQSR